MNPTAQRRGQLRRAFAQSFGGEPSVWVRAPGRVDLMGSHTDYNRGLVLTLPIDLDTWIAARRRPDRWVRVRSLNLQTETQFNLDDLRRGGDLQWGDYVRGVAAVLREEGFPLCGFDAIVQGTVPVRSGLSSSAALECATATLFASLGEWKLDPVRKALLCQRAENQFVGVHCGILDQYTSCAGKAGCALLLDCRDLSHRASELAPGIQVVVCNTNYQRELAGSEYGTRRAQCAQGASLLGVASLREVSLAGFRNAEAALPAEVARRCRFIIEENDRVPRLATALATGDQAAIRQLCADSFRGACELYEIAVPAMRSMMEAMLAAPGVIGARQAGAGFGGCMVAFVNASQATGFVGSVRRDYFDRTGIQPEIHAVRAAAGAGELADHEAPDSPTMATPAEGRAETGSE